MLRVRNEDFHIWW